MGVLQRIAICYFFPSLIFCTFRLRGMIAICLSLLLGYWALMTFVPIRDFNLETSHLQKVYAEAGTTNAAALFEMATHRVTGRFEDGLNLAQQVEFQFLPGRKWDVA